MELIRFWQAHLDELLALLRQHVVLVSVSTLAAVVLGVPAGVVAARRPPMGRVILAVVNVAQTIPSLALLGFLLPLPFIGGIGPRTALVALTIYALLPIVRTTMSGLAAIDRTVLEAGVAMGMTPRQRLFIVELPLALPQIVAGVRVATVIGVGTATIAAAIGAGGLGEYIFRGLAMVDTTTILAGAVPAAVLALAGDRLLTLIEWLLSWRRRRGRRRAVAGAAAVVAVAFGFAALTLARPSNGTVVVGSKNFTEQVILGELVAQALEGEGVPVVRKLNLGGTFVCDQGLRGGTLDVYVEYTGTAVSAIFNEDVPRDSGRALDRTRELYAERQVTVLQPLGFNNTFTILVRGSDARALGLRTIDDLRPHASSMRPGFGHEFLQRNDGYPGLIQAYELAFPRPRGMELSLIYGALRDGQVDVIAGDATSAMIDRLDLVPLEDSRGYFPPYDAVPVARTATLHREPRLARAVARLAGRIADADMRALNAAVDVEKRPVAEVVREFLRRIT